MLVAVRVGEGAHLLLRVLVSGAAARVGPLKMASRALIRLVNQLGRQPRVVANLLHWSAIAALLVSLFFLVGLLEQLLPQREVVMPVVVRLV